MMNMNMGRTHTRQRIGRLVLGVLVMGLVMPAYGQVCDPVEVAKLLADDREWGDEFGASVSISGDTAIVGATRDDDNGANSGSAYVFTRSGGMWIQQAKLLPTDGAAGDMFGASVSISGDTAIVGAIWDDDNGVDSGSAYIFTRSGGMWTQRAKLLPTSGMVGDWFGYSVSIIGDTAVIGALGSNDNGMMILGSAYVFTRTAGVWTEQAKLTSADLTSFFAYSVSFDGNTVVIGAWGDTDNGANSGSAYVFTRSGVVWSQQAKLLPADGAAWERFGNSVSINGDTIAIGTKVDSLFVSSPGSAYVFTRSGGVWTQQTKLVSSDGTEDDWFGYSVSISDDTAVIGANLDDDSGTNSGSAYVFTRIGNVWTQHAKILPADGMEWGQLGNSVSIDGDTAVIGAYLDRDGGISSGSAYIFDLNCSNCPADLTGNGTLNFFDVSTFLSAFAAQDPIADFTNDGIFNFFDVSAFLAAFAAGCP